MSLLFGALWGLFIFNLDRWIISTIDYRTLRRDLVYSREIGIQINVGQATQRAQAAVFVNGEPQYVTQLSPFKAALSEAAAAEKAAAVAVPGLLEREDALSELAAKCQTVNIARWLLRGLILLIDVAPVLIKILSPRTAFGGGVRVRLRTSSRLGILCHQGT